jgi:hypothetical protein
LNYGISFRTKLNLTYDPSYYIFLSPNLKSFGNRLSFLIKFLKVTWCVAFEIIIGADSLYPFFNFID